MKKTLTEGNVPSCRPSQNAPSCRSSKGKSTAIIFSLLLAIFCVALHNNAYAQDWRATAPYSCSFDDTVENAAWVLLNGDSTILNKWVIDSAVDNTNAASAVPGSSKSLYISDSEGAILDGQPSRGRFISKRPASIGCSLFGTTTI